MTRSTKDDTAAPASPAEIDDADLDGIAAGYSIPLENATIAQIKSEANSGGSSSGIKMPGSYKTPNVTLKRG